MIKTKFQEILGTRYPIIQAGMGPYSTNKLCIAASKAGALGLISTVGMVPGVVAPKEATELVFGSGSPKDVFKDTIERVYEAIKDTPDAKFGANIPVSNEFTKEAKIFIDVIIEIFEEKPEIKKNFVAIFTSAGDPLPWAVNAQLLGAKQVMTPIKEKLPDIIWVHVCPSVRGAKRAEKAGVDMIVASGREGGAHCAWRDASSIVLLPETVKSVKVPVIGAGGYSDGSSLAAALALGAVGIQMGTRFIATRESDFEQKWKEAIVDRDETETVVARGIFGPMRFLRNEMSLKLVGETIQNAPDLFRGVPCKSTPGIFELEMEGFENLMKDKPSNEALVLGGVVTGRIHAIPTVKELIEEIMTEAQTILTELPKMVQNHDNK
ncbi:MAG: nitronate monooxygenase [Candidatus Lokiarchaeota archaeon]|nr:nitronate monooxygenase [Candidatus Lokiarchaeota archaeon]